MKQPILRGYFGGIFYEFVLQDRLADAIIILPGFPSRNDFKDLIKFFFERGYHVFVPRYRGSYQSSGIFLSKNPVDDLILFTEHLKKGEAKSLWDMEKKTFKINKKILLTESFGAPIALGLAAKSKEFSHVIVQAPIWDFVTHNRDKDEQDLAHLSDFVQRAYKNCYRFKLKNIMRKLWKFDELRPEYYLPIANDSALPVLAMHDTNDRMVAFKKTKEMSERMKRFTLIEHYLGHKLKVDVLGAFWKDIDKFIKINYVN